MPNKANRLKRRFTLSVGLVARKITLESDVGRAQVRTSNLGAPDLKIQMTTIQIQRYKSHTTNQHRPTPNLHPRTMTQKTNFATTLIQPTSVRPTVHQIGPPNKLFHNFQQQLMGYPSVVWQQQMEKATVITYINTPSLQKPIPVWDPDYTTTFSNRFRSIPLIDDYNPKYFDPDYGRDPYWDTEIYNQDLLQFQHALDDIELYQRTVHKSPPIPHNKKTRALIETWQMNDGTNHPVFLNPLGTEDTETADEPTPKYLLDEKQFQSVLITKDGEPDCIPLSTNINLNCKKRMLYFPMDVGN